MNRILEGATSPQGDGPRKATVTRGLPMIYRIEADFLRTNDALAKRHGKERRKREKQEDQDDAHTHHHEHQDDEALIDLVA